jgi:hypothetical protein
MCTTAARSMSAGAGPTDRANKNNSWLRIVTHGYERRQGPALPGVSIAPDNIHILSVYLSRAKQLILEGMTKGEVQAPQ